jgi:hypothetical protein
MNTELNALHARLERLEQDNARMERDNVALRTQFDTERHQNHSQRRRLRIQCGLAFCAFLGAVLISPTNRSAIAQGYGVTLQQLNTRLTAVEAKTQFQSVNTTARSTTFSGCNVFVNAGGGTTDTIVTNAAGDGLGNLTIGYNALRTNITDVNIRTGSHNLTVGDQNNYSSYGGVVFGLFNTASNIYASVSGGVGNVANGPNASVSGGIFNTASGQYSSVGGGGGNKAQGNYSFVSGGIGNTASEQYSSITGGQGNTASGYAASVTGGNGNTASGIYSSISGGGSLFSGVTISSSYGWAAGGTGSGTYHSP